MAVNEAAAVTTAGLWIDRATAVNEQVTRNATATAAGIWSGFSGWYSLTEISGRAQEAAALSAQAQQALTAVYIEYVAQVVAMLRDQRIVTVPPLRLPDVRDGVNPVKVHSRPAEAYRRTYAMTEDEDAAMEAALAREIELIETDIALATRQAEHDAMKGLGVDRYRRVLRPELSKTGSCGLCIAAAQQVYTIGTLLPIHPPSCKCRTMPIEDGVDPAFQINETDLASVLSSTDRTDLSHVRVQVREHGEHGPVLTVRGQKFTGKKDLKQGIDADVARKQLDALEPVLASLERRAAAGEPVSGPLEYQRRLVARLRAIATP